jgi:hypothetical protein
MADTDLLNPRECAAYRRCSVRKLDRERADAAVVPMYELTVGFSIDAGT